MLIKGSNFKGEASIYYWWQFRFRMEVAMMEHDKIIIFLAENYTIIWKKFETEQFGYFESWQNCFLKP